MWTFWKVLSLAETFVYRTYSSGTFPTVYQRWNGKTWIDVGFPNVISDSIYDGDPAASEISEHDANAIITAA